MSHVKVIKQIMFATSAIATLIVVPNFMDPFSLPKLSLLSIGVGLISIVFLRNKHGRSIVFPKRMVQLFSLYIFLYLVSALISSQNLNSILLGGWGRNNGFLIIIFIFIFFLASSVPNKDHQFSVLQYLYFLGLILCIYAWLEYFGKDFLVLLFPYLESPSFPILTFGNSNFASVFLAITFTATLAKFLDFSYLGFKAADKLIPFISIVLHCLLIPRIDTQGKIAFGIGAAIVIYIFLLYSKFKVLKYSAPIFGVTSIIIGVAGVLGLFGAGPFAAELADNIRALNDRYYAWLTAINIIKEYPVFGIGPGNFVDSYRLFRLTSSPEIQSGQYYLDFDDAHNTYLQVGATSGIPCMIAYISLIILVSVKGVKLLLKKSNSTTKTAGIFAIWIIYVVTSLISIDYIVLAIWGWICAGSLFAISSSNDLSNIEGPPNSKHFVSIPQNKLISNTFMLIMLSPSLYLLPSITQDMKVFEAIKSIPLSKSQEQFDLNTAHLANLGTRIDQAELRITIIDYLGYATAFDDAIVLAQYSIKKDPASFWAWEFLARSYEAQGRFKEAIPARLKTLELDPLNSLIKSKILENDSK